MQRTVAGCALVITAVCLAPVAAGRISAQASRSAPLDGLVQGLASGSLEVLDLTQPLSERTPIIQLPPPFANTPGFEKRLISEYDAKGPAWYWNWFSVG